MDFAPSAEQLAVTESANRILTARVDNERLAQRVGEAPCFDRTLWAELGRADLLGLAMPTSLGGSGQGLLELCALLVCLGRAAVPVPAYALVLGGVLPVLHLGTAAQQQRFLAGVASGERIITAALREPGAADMHPAVTIAHPIADGWVVSGHKTCVPVAAAAHHVLLAAATPAGPRFMLVPGDAAGLSVRADTSTGLEPQSELILDEVVVPDDHVLSCEGDGTAEIEWLRLRAVVGICALQLGVAERALEMTAAYTGQREQFGRLIGSFQLVAGRAADAFIDLEAMRVSMWQAAWRVENGEGLATASVAVAKHWADRGGHRITAAAQHLHGGTGADVTYPVHWFYRWSRQLMATLEPSGHALSRLGGLFAAEHPPLL